MTGPPWPFAGISADAQYVRWGPCTSGQGPGRDSPLWMMNSLRDNKGSYRAVPVATNLGVPGRMLKGLLLGRLLLKDLCQGLETIGDPIERD